VRTSELYVKRVSRIKAAARPGEKSEEVRGKSEGEKDNVA
jgi:hypothetical protein